MDWVVNNIKFIEVVIAVLFAVIVFALFAVFTRKKDHQTLSEKVAKIEDTYLPKDKHTTLEQRVNTVETQLTDLPDSKDFSRLEKEVGELKGELEGMNKLLANINNHVNMLVENEIKGSK